MSTGAKCLVTVSVFALDAVIWGGRNPNNASRAISVYGWKEGRGGGGSPF